MTIKANKAEQKRLLATLATVYAFYRQDASTSVLDMWINLMGAYDYAAVEDAITRHMRGDRGTFLPMPGELIKLMDGGTEDAALVAWSKVDRAVRGVGSWESVVFDDELIHLAINDMGGWERLCMGQEKEWPFVAKEFQNRYRGFRIRGNITAWPNHLPGTVETTNSVLNGPKPDPIMIGDATKCEAVYRGGVDKLLTNMQPLRLPEIVRA